MLRISHGDTGTDFKAPWSERLNDVNRELWLLLSLFAISGLINWCLRSNGMMLTLYMLPSVFSAFSYGRRHAVMTALASILLVVAILLSNPEIRVGYTESGEMGRWLDVAVWGGLLIVVSYAMGTLYDKKESHFLELRRTYFGVLTLLQQFIGNDKYSHNHCYRVAVYAAVIASRMGLDERAIDELRAAALLHDIAKLEGSRELLEKAAQLSKNPLDRGRSQPMTDFHGQSLSRILPIVLAHHEIHNPEHGNAAPEDIPLETRILAVADTYDNLTSDRPYRRAITPFDAKDVIVRGAGESFDPRVVDAFVLAFDSRRLEVPETMVLA